MTAPRPSTITSSDRATVARDRCNHEHLDYFIVRDLTLALYGRRVSELTLMEQRLLFAWIRRSPAKYRRMAEIRESLLCAVGARGYADECSLTKSERTAAATKAGVPSAPQKCTTPELLRLLEAHFALRTAQLMALEEPYRDLSTLNPMESP